MKIESSIKATQVERIVKETHQERVYTLTLTRHEVNLLRGLHFRLHNWPDKSVTKALDNYPLGCYSSTDGPAGYKEYDKFLGDIWWATNPFNQEYDL